MSDILANGQFNNYSSKDIYDNDLTEPFNPLDPIVYHDGLGFAKPVTKLIMSNEDAKGNDAPGQERNINNIHIDGTIIPIVKLNHLVLEKDNIESLSILYTDVVPTLHIVVKDNNNKFNFPDRPGLNNDVRVIIMPEADGKYKKISLTFYITEAVINEDKTKATYKCILKHMPFIQQAVTSDVIKFPGCTSLFCNVPKNNKPNMWELFHEVAEKCGLGFAAMKSTKEYVDRMPRIINHQSYKELIEYNISVGGTNDTQIYDGWVDLYGYLTLVDLYKAMNDPIEPSNLVIYNETGLSAHKNGMMMTDFQVSRRVITNHNMTGALSNTDIAEYWENSTMSNIYEHGTLNSTFYFNPLGNNGVNGVEMNQIRIKENSKDGRYVEDYEINKYDGWSFVGCEERNIAYQKNVRDAYLSKIRGRMLTVLLKQPNYGLQRGTLVTVVIEKFDYKSKQMIASQTSVLYDELESERVLPDDIAPPYNGISQQDILHNDAIGLIDPTLSGIYYIDGMRFDYFDDNEEIQQYLYLIRRGSLTGYFNITSMPKLDDSILN